MSWALQSAAESNAVGLAFCEAANDGQMAGLSAPPWRSAADRSRPAGAPRSRPWTIRTRPLDRPRCPSSDHREELVHEHALRIVSVGARVPIAVPPVGVGDKGAGWLPSGQHGLIVLEAEVVKGVVVVGVEAVENEDTGEIRSRGLHPGGNDTDQPPPPPADGWSSQRRDRGERPSSFRETAAGDEIRASTPTPTTAPRPARPATARRRRRP